MRLIHDERGSGPLVVLLHGFPLDRAMWSAQLEGLSARYRVVAPDLRGHGSSPPPEGVSTMEAMADDVVELLDVIAPGERVVLGGLSMGGYVALAALAKYPVRFRALLLLDTRAVADAPEAARNREATASQVEASGDTRAVVEGMIPRLFAESTRAERPELVASITRDMFRSTPAGVAASLRGMAARPDRSGFLPTIAIPTLVVVGEHDVISTPEESRSIAESIPGARLAVIPRAGHLAPRENPGDTNDAILAFLRSID